MITILIARNDNKLDKLIEHLLQDGGYSLLKGPEDNRIINAVEEIVIKKKSNNSASIEELIVEIEKSLNRDGLTPNSDEGGVSALRGNFSNEKLGLNNGKKGVLYKSILEKIEKPIFERMLARTYGNQLKAARILGINRNTMRAKIKKLGIDPEVYKQ